MKRPVFVIVAILAIISYTSKINSQEPSSVPAASTEVQPTTPTESSQPVEVPQPTEPQPEPQETTSTPAVSEEKPKEGSADVLIDDALPDGSAIEGTWDWDSILKYSGERSHTEPAKKEFAQHSYKSNPIEIPKNSVIEQYVYLDPNEIPKGIMLKFSVENGANDGEVGVYWEGEEEIFVYNNDEPMLYYGVLPNAGKWEKLEVYSEDLGLEGVKLTGISFVAYGGKANWDLTKIRPIKEGEGYPQAEELPAEDIKK